jgi:hypothetical protein
VPNTYQSQDHFSSDPDSYDAFVAALSELGESLKTAAPDVSADEKRLYTRQKLDALFYHDPELLSDFDSFFADKEAKAKVMLSYGMDQENAVGLPASGEPTPAQVAAMHAHSKDLFSCDCGNKSVEAV